MTEIIKLDGSIREKIGGSSARKLRKEHRLPGVIYSESKESNIYIDLDGKQFEKEYFKGGVQSKIIEINTPDKTFKVIINAIDLDPVSDRPRHIDFISVDSKKEVKAFIDINFINKEKSTGLKNGGYLNILIRKLPLICDINKIPSSIIVDCSDLRLRNSIKISTLNLPEGTKPSTKKDLLIARIIGRGKDIEDDQTTAAPAATATTTTATAAKK